MSSSPDRPTSIPNVVLLGDSLGTMPSISDRGPGMLEKQLLPDIDEPWRLTIIRADDSDELAAQKWFVSSGLYDDRKPAPIGTLLWYGSVS